MMLKKVFQFIKIFYQITKEDYYLKIIKKIKKNRLIELDITDEKYLFYKNSLAKKKTLSEIFDYFLD